MAEVKPDVETFARIKVIGVGGAGGNAIERMIECGLAGIDFVAINTDAQDLHQNKAGEKIHIGKNLTRGLGAGMNPDVGRQAAEENRDEIQEILKGADMVFVVYGAGGGTGSGAAPVVAETAKEAGALTVGVATKPFTFEGRQRMAIAEESLDNFRDRVDALITIQNDKLLQIIDRNTSLVNSFRIVDDVLRQGVQGISDLITKPGIVNVDFADINAIMQESGTALMGIGVSSGDKRAIQAAKSAINSPLLDVSIDGAKGVLFNITGGDDVAMMEVNEAAGIIADSVDPNARIIFGASKDEGIKQGELRITVVATGFEFNSAASSRSYLASNPRKKIRLTPEVDYDQEDQEGGRVEDDDTPSQQFFNFGKVNQAKLSSKEPPVNGPNVTSAGSLSHRQQDDEVIREKISRKEPVSFGGDGFSFRRTKIDVEEDEGREKDGPSRSNPRQSSGGNRSKPNSDPGGSDYSDEDLDIPAFIRRKLGE
jgi:cell division protein FtsZ